MKFVFHIGAGKTGSSAIQTALRLNREQLVGQGYYLPATDLTVDGKVRGTHIAKFVQLRDMESESAVGQLNKLIPPLITEAESCNAHTIIFSSEDLSNAFAWSEMLRPAMRGHDVEVVLYIRRQDNYLLSAWQQWGIKRGRSFDEFLIDSVGKTADWRVTIEEWQKLTDPDKIHVRVYERNELVDHDVVADFLHVVGVDGSQFKTGPKQVNPSYSIAAEELARTSASLFKDSHDPGFFRFLDSAGITAHRKNPRVSRITHRERILILNRYRESNQWIRDNYLRDLKRPTLFTPPKPSDYRVVTEAEIEQQKWALVTELLYSQYQQGQNDPKRS